MITIPNTEGTITIEELTQVSVGGEGTFDKLMAAVKLHLQEELNAGRIRGSDYTNVYIHAIEAVLAQSTNYALAKSRLGLELQQLQAATNKITTETALVIKQGAQVDAETCKVQAETKQVNYVTNTQLVAKVAQDAEEHAAKIEQIAAQTNKITTETALTIKQGAQVDAQTCKLNADTKQVQYTTSTVLPAQVENQRAATDNVRKEIALKEYQLTEIFPAEVELRQAETALKGVELTLRQREIEVAIAKLANIPKEGALLVAQTAGQAAQTALYTQKTTTERAQTDSSVIGSNSIIDLQNKLYTAQTDSYKRNAEQAAAKILVESWTARYANDPDGNDENAANGLLDSNIGRAVNKLLAGIGAS